MTGAGAGAAAAIADAIKASGVLVRVEPDAFSIILKKGTALLVVYSAPGTFQRKHEYMTSYKGLAFFTKSKEPLYLPPGTEIIEAKSIMIPG